jgi:uncharacterized membrane protein YccC
MNNTEITMFILQGVLGMMMLFFGIILNSMLSSIKEVNRDLKALNSAVLGNYVTRETHDRKWEEQRKLDHDMRDSVQQVLLEQAKTSALMKAREENMSAHRKESP